MQTAIGSSAELEITHTPDQRSETQPRGTSERFITFELGGTSYGIVASAVQEVTEQLPVTTLPNSPQYLSGIAPLRDEVAAVVNLRAILDETPPKEGGSRSRSVVLKKLSPEHSPIAFVADRLGEIAQIEIASIVAEPEGSEVMLGAAADGNRKLRIIDHRRLASGDLCV